MTQSFPLVVDQIMTNFPRGLFLVVFLFIQSANAENPDDSKSPNFVIFLTDDQGWGDLGCYGHPVIKSPHLDQFAKQGVRLTQCYSACSVCSPSRSSILTGRTPYRNGVWRWIPSNSIYHLRASEITIASILKKRGYDTCHVGKWHLNGKFNSTEQPQPDDHGYDHWLATQNNAAPNHLNPTNFVRNRKPVGKLSGPSSILCVEEAMDWLKNRKDKQKPFFLTVWTHEPHLPIESAEKFMKPYSAIEDEGIRQHHGNITQMDQAFGNLMNGLNQMGYENSTCVFYTSDNGPEGAGNKGRTRGSTGGLRGRKRHSHEGGIRVPGIIRWPGKIKAGSENSQPVIGSDFFATICEIVGEPIPEDRIIDGASLLPLFSGKTVEREQPLYWRNHLAPASSRVALREGDWKILGSDDLKQFEMYNIKEDWQEQKELSKVYPEQFARLKMRLIEHDQSVLADGPDWWKTEENKRPRRKNSMKKLPPGRDKTGEFDKVLGGTISATSNGYLFASDHEALALKKMDTSGASSIRIQTSYAAAKNSGITRNAAIVLSSSPNNNDSFKIGTAIGMGKHVAFPGGWQNVGLTRSAKATFQTRDEFEIVVEVDLKSRKCVARIDGTKMSFVLPETIKNISWVGFYVKDTQTEFGKLEVKTVRQ